MWWDVRRGFSAVDLSGDPTVVASIELLAVIEHLSWTDLHLLDERLRDLENHVSTLPQIEFRNATVEMEAEYVDRPINGEVILSAPHEEDVLLLAAALNEQILTAPARWRLDLHENLCGMIEARLQQQPRAERLRLWLADRTLTLTLRRRALRQLRRAREEEKSGSR